MVPEVDRGRLCLDDDGKVAMRPATQQLKIYHCVLDHVAAVPFPQQRSESGVAVSSAGIDCLPDNELNSPR